MRIVGAVMIIGLLAAGACGDTESSDDTAPDLVTPTSLTESSSPSDASRSSAPASTTSTTALSEDSATATSTSDMVQWEPGVVVELAAGQATFPILGGLSMELPVGTLVVVEGNTVDADPGCILFDMPPGTDSPTGQVAIAAVYGAAAETIAAGTSVEALLAQYPAEVRPVPTGESIDLLGVEFQRYVIADGPSLLEGGGFGCAPLGEPNLLGFHPGRFGAMYMAPFDTGVVVLSASGWEQADADIAIAFLEEMVPTITRSS